MSAEPCTLFDVNYLPARMSVRELKEGLYWLGGQLYSRECTEARRQGFFRQWRHGYTSHNDVGLHVA